MSIMKALKIAGGFVLLVGGAIMLVTPGPGWLAIAGGLAVLASEFRWAERLLNRLKHGAMRLKTRG
jgi:uncharacterized protein (TIGR02611 family)